MRSIYGLSVFEGVFPGVNSTKTSVMVVDACFLTIVYVVGLAGWWGGGRGWDKGR